MAKAPDHVIANNLGFSEAAPFRKPGASIAPAT
jgi:hypothetical protein